MKTDKLNGIKKEIESALKFFIDIYCRSLLVTYLFYYLIYVLESMFVQILKTDEQAALLWCSVSSVSFFAIYIWRSADRKIEKPQMQRRALTTGEILKYHISKSWAWELTCLFIVVLGSMLLGELFPFCLVYTYTNGTIGFMLCVFLAAIMQALGFLVAVKSNRPRSSYAPWYRVSLWLGVVFLIFVLFTPTSFGSEPRNIPLFYACVCLAAIIFIIRFLIRVARLSSYANKLKLRKARDVKCNYFKLRNKCDLSYAMKGERVNVVFLYRIEKFARHYFEDCYTIRRFLRMGIATRGGGGARMSSIAHWTEIGEIRLPWRKIKENEKYIIVWKKFPTEIADENSRNNTIGNNDLAVGKILILNVDSFREYISK